jgi:hypothetical protein
MDTDKKLVALCLMFCGLSVASEKGAYDTSGRLTALLSDADDVELATNVVAVLPTGKRVSLMSHREGKEASRKGDDLEWSHAFELPDGSRGQLGIKSEEDATGLKYTATIHAENAFDIDGLELVLDLPRALLLKGALVPEGAASVALAATKAASPVLFRGDTTGLHWSDAASNVKIDLGFDHARTASVIDRWDERGRSYQVRMVIVKGPVASGTNASLPVTIRLANHPPAAPPAHVTVDATKSRFTFDGFGGDYCWDTKSPISLYTIENLKVGWARTEMKLLQWDKHRDTPTEAIRGDMEMMRRFQQLGIPYVISIWWLPERIYTDAYEKPKAAHFRLIAPDKWDDLLDMIGSYLLYAKREYGTEPDFFSFNESNIGIYVGLTPETHVEAIKRIGAHLQKLGLKTRMLLGDATGPKDTHKFVLDGASDPEALKYVGAVAFHSWGGGTPEQYAAWGEVAEWLSLPLLVTELGVDAGAYHSRGYNSYHYGLREAKMTQELIMYAHPQGTQYWQFTNDYALARVGDGGKVTPTSRFFLVKHFTDLTPRHSEGLAVSSDQGKVLATAFRKDGKYVVHVLNNGAARDVTIGGVPAGLTWKRIETTEAAPYVDRGATGLELQLPPHSLTTLVSQ